MQIRRIDAKDYSDYLKIRLIGLANSPEAFGMSVNEAPKIEQNNFEDNTAGNNAIFISYNNANEACGVIGVRRLKGEKRQHIALVWGLYVSEPERQKKIATHLMKVAIEFSKATGAEKLQLSVNAENSTTYQFYKKIGFESYGTEKKALKLIDRYYDEHLMEMFL